MSLGGFFNAKTSSDNQYGLGITYTTLSEDSLLHKLKSYDVILPELNFELHYTFVKKTYSINIFSDINIFDKEIYYDNSYIKIGIDYNKSFKNIDTQLEINLGSNFTSEFKTPEIPLPYLYYDIALKNKLFCNTIELKIGWKYEIYNTILSNFENMANTVPQKYPNILNLEEDLINNKLYIELDYLY